VRLVVVPQSLFGRLLLALLAAIGVSLLVIVALLLRERRELLSAGSETAAIVEVITATAQTLAALDRDARAAEVERLERGVLVISSAGQSRQGGQPPDNAAAAARVLENQLARLLGAEYAVTVAPAEPGPVRAIRVGRGSRRGPFAPPPGVHPSERRVGPERTQDPGARGPGFRLAPGFAPRELDVRVTLPDGDTARFRTDVPRAPPSLPLPLLFQLALVTLVLGAVLYAMARTITRPLRELAAAAEAVGRGARFQPLRETGARELREAMRAFNTMQERLNRYLDSRTRVLSAMSHDLRTPLTRLKLRVESLPDEALRERFNADLDEMNRMVAGALNLFKGLNHDEPLAPLRIEDLLDELRHDFADLGATIVIVGAASAPVMVRRDALKRCLTNLVGNAVKYGGGAEIVVSEEGADLVIRVRDEGPGIPVDMLERVFEPFFRLEGSRNVDTGGAGLGLSIARDVAQAHGGSLMLRNREPRGLEAELRLPRMPAR
jgi:signal transduction histidine kinase